MYGSAVVLTILYPVEEMLRAQWYGAQLNICGGYEHRG